MDAQQTSGTYDGQYPSDGVLHLVKTAGTGASLYRVKQVKVYEQPLDVDQLTQQHPPEGA
jgi:hypothetical protein